MAIPDFARVLRASKIHYGRVRIQGAPAILFGVATVIVAAGAVRALTAGAPNLPESIREFRHLLESGRKDPKKLPS
jgi:hypothetical protein